MNPNYSYIDTELSAVNSILGSIGQAPTQSLDLENPEVHLAYNILQECLIDVLNEGWSFNREEGITLSPEDVNGYIRIPPNILRCDISKGQTHKTTDVVIRNGRLYDKIKHTDKFTEDVDVDVVWLFGFEVDLTSGSTGSLDAGQNIPEVFKRYIIAKSSAKAAVQLVNNPQLFQMLRQEETLTRAACIEYECDQGDYSYFGTPNKTVYESYQPYRTLSRI